MPRRHGQPCLKLITTTAFVIRELHPIYYTHVGRTKKIDYSADQFLQPMHEIVEQQLFYQIKKLIKFLIESLLFFSPYLPINTYSYICEQSI